MFVLSGIYMGLLHGIYVPDWKYEQEFALSSSSMQIGDVIEKVKSFKRICVYKLWFFLKRI